MTRGRPRTERSSLGVKVTVRLTADELARIVKAARGTPLAVWIREAAIARTATRDER